MRRHDCGDRNGGRDYGIVDVAVNIDVDWVVSGKIPCNRAMDQVPGGRHPYWRIVE